MQQKFYGLFSCSSFNEQQNIQQTATKYHIQKDKEGNRTAHDIN